MAQYSLIVLMCH